MGGGSAASGANSLKMFWEEKELHEKTKLRLAEEQSKAKDDKTKIQKLEKRIGVRPFSGVPTMKINSF